MEDLAALKRPRKKSEPFRRMPPTGSCGTQPNSSIFFFFFKKKPTTLAFFSTFILYTCIIGFFQNGSLKNMQSYATIEACRRTGR